MDISTVAYITAFTLKMPSMNMCRNANFSKDLLDARANIKGHSNNFVFKRRHLLRSNRQEFYLHHIYRALGVQTLSKRARKTT